MGKQIVFITGAARSGKSRYAEERASALGARCLYVATAQPSDEEMIRRISAHQRRRGSAWPTIEVSLALSDALRAWHGQIDSALVDCLTLWLSNLLVQRGEQYAQEKVQELVQTLPRLDFHLVLVTNEVGWAIVPDNPLARQFRDLAGWANQQIAAVANEVVLMVTGVPLIVKKEET
jgi:adenosylcobinamide kinase / adenosylcobinamide-phosphate guanylyltransferase